MKMYTIRGHKWSNVATYSSWDVAHEFPNYAALEDKIEIRKEFENMSLAHIWFLQNLPEYALGCNIRCEETGDFMCEAVKGYHVAQFGTEDTHKIIQEIIKAERKALRESREV